MSIATTIRRILGRSNRKPITADLSQRSIHGRYDAAQTTNEMQNYWAAADALDADACNSLAVRRKLRNQSRYQIANDGDAKGIILTNTNYMVGLGPKLRMQTSNPGMNAMVEAAWDRWCNATKFYKKLRTLHKAKCGDGEGFAQLTHNPAIKDIVQLNFVPFECDRATDPLGLLAKPRYIDGIQFDEYGNPVSYDILKYHPGGVYAWPLVGGMTGKNQYETIPAKFIIHWFREDRPGQHRSVPEASSTLNLFGQDRRYTEAVIAAAETAADISATLEQPASNDGDDVATPFSTLPIEKRMLIALPSGGKLAQFKAEQPTTTYVEFKQENSRGKARPYNMPNNIARADSSGYSFSGGKLDHKTFFVSIDVDQDDAELDVLNPVFEVWFEEATKMYGWTFDATPAPKHTWDWPGKPVIDEVKAADANETDLANGVKSLTRIYAEAGLDWEDELPVLAKDFHKTDDEMREALFQKIYGNKSSGLTDKQVTRRQNNYGDNPPAKANDNGHNRLAVTEFPLRG